MKKVLLLILLGTACSPKSGFHAFFEDEVAHADQAIDLPKWLPMLAIPSEAKEDIRLFTKGMKRVKLLRYEKRREDGKERFLEFKEKAAMEEFLSIVDEDIKMNVISKEEGDVYKEIIIGCETNSEYLIMGLTGKMKKKDFTNAVVEANKKQEDNSND